MHNNILMRMNSHHDISLSERRFSFVPPRLLCQVSHLELGEGLLAGKVSPDPTTAKIEGRPSPEGGGIGVDTTWAKGDHA